MFKIFGCKSTTFASGLQEFWSKIRQKMMATPPTDLLHFDFESMVNSMENLFQSHQKINSYRYVFGYVS
jgi:hypothetical protein